MVIKNKTGFTLIEVMVVVIIIGILASISIPSFNKSMDNARAKEAHSTLELIYNAQKIYKLDKKIYSTSLDGMASYLDNPNNTAEYYTYEVSATGGTSFVAKADRNGGGASYTIDQAGTKNW